MTRVLALLMVFAAATACSPHPKDLPERVDLRRIGHFAPKGRAQDQQPPLPAVEALIAAGPVAIDFLTAKLEDQTEVEGRVFDYWPVVRVGDVALAILCDLLTDASRRGPTVPGMSWDELLDNRDPDRASWDVLGEFVAAHGRAALRQRVQARLAPYAGRLRWDPQERCFRPVE